MNENDTITNDEWNIENIIESLHSEFNIETEYLGYGLIAISELDGYIKSEETYEDIEFLAENIIQWLRYRFNYDFDYKILDGGRELVIQVI